MTEYEFIKLIGMGSYGEVVQAKHRATGQIVAIKLIEDLFKNSYDSKKIVREIQILRQFTQMANNQFTTKIFDVITPSNPNDLSHIFIVMEYMQTDLKKIFQSMQQLDFSEDHMISILYSLLCSLNFMHTANVMHRDIKPANLLVDADCRVKICDFGLSRSQPEMEEPRGRLSRKETAKKLIDEQNERIQKPRDLSNHVVSRWYRSPEIILVEKNYTSSVDIWSSGCILSEMISCTE
jgi:mitogen-activated protein kinase 1/3